MQLLSDLSLKELTDAMPNEKPFRAEQVFKWVSLGAKFEQMSNIPLALRQQLAAKYSDTAVSVIEQIKAPDKSVKLLYKLIDGNVIEGVYMPHSYADTLCVSTQVGCRMGCKFCASTIGGLVRNLSAGEIYSQVLTANSLFLRKLIVAKGEVSGKKSGRGVDNIVLMGSGEPLDNYNNVTKFLQLVNHEKGLNISQRNISLSTCGIPSNIKKLADDGFCVNLSLSLHAADDEKRKTIMPTANRYSLNEIIDSCRYYFNKTRRRIIFEYTMISGVNMFDSDVKNLKSLIKNMAAHVNLIMLNHVEESGLKPCTQAQARQFLAALTHNGISATLRRSAGTQVYGGCGQLRRKFVGSEDATHGG